MGFGKASKIGIAFVIAYAGIFVYAFGEAIRTCPSWFCDLGLALATIPWSLLFEPQFNIFDLSRPESQTGKYVVDTIFFVFNSLLLYLFGAALSRFFRWWRGRRDGRVPA